MAELFLHPVESGKTIESLYKMAFAEAVELYVLSAYLRSWDTTLKLNKECKEFAFIIGEDFGITRTKACTEVLAWLRQRKPFFLVTSGISGFHPKALLWKKKNGGCHALIGSSNLTEGGRSTNYEANVHLILSAKQFDEAKRWIGKICGSAEQVSNWLETYVEAPASRRKGKGGNGALNASSAVVLPSVRSSSKIIAERKSKKKQFTAIRHRLESAIRRCATGKISNPRFYEVLNDLWGDGPSRIQGWGWHVTGRDSDFKTLCGGLVSILDAEKGARDFTVLTVIDKLNEKDVPTRRALLSELLCLFFPAEYPILNKPVALYTRPYIKAPYGSTEGEKYLHLARSLRTALRSNPGHPAKDLVELDGLIWKIEDLRKKKREREMRA
jgi:hypothetical protein